MAAYDKTKNGMAFFDPSRPQDFIFISGTKVSISLLAFSVLQLCCSRQVSCHVLQKWCIFGGSDKEVTLFLRNQAMFGLFKSVGGGYVSDPPKVVQFWRIILRCGSIFVESEQHRLYPHLILRKGHLVTF